MVLRWLDENRPYGLHMGGDTNDFTTLSKYRWEPDMVPDRDRAVRACLDSSKQVATEYVQAGRPKVKTHTGGNHDVRLENYVLDHASALWGIRQDLEVLMGLDKLGFTWPKKRWPHGEVKISSKLAQRHGWIVRKASGASAHATLLHLGYSCIIGHTHRQGMSYITRHDIDGSTATLVGVEAGTLATLDGLGYATAPDWQQGFATARVQPDGTFSAGLATYVNGVLRWENQSYMKTGRGIKVER